LSTVPTAVRFLLAGDEDPASLRKRARAIEDLCKDSVHDSGPRDWVDAMRKRADEIEATWASQQAAVEQATCSHESPMSWPSGHCAGCQRTWHFVFDTFEQTWGDVIAALRDVGYMVFLDGTKIHHVVCEDCRADEQEKTSG